MKKTLICLGFAVSALSLKTSAQGSPANLDVVSWNLEFFGAPFASGPADKDLQETNVKNIMSWLNADLFGLLEVVDTMRLRRVVDFLGNTEFGFTIAPYCSGNSTGTGNGWLNGQKQAFIYRKSVFSNVTTRGLMRNSATANTNWASGRFPYLLSATATINGTSKNVNFILLHGKAGSGLDDFQKRAGGCAELKDTLDTYFSSTLNFIIGDYNDALHTSIYPGSSVSSYTSLISDSTDADSYKSVTLPLGVAGQSSMINFPNVIDNHVVSNEVTPLYIPGTAQVKTDVTVVVPNYVTAHNTSDHYPVMSRYNLAGIITGLPVVTLSELGLSAGPNPFSSQLNLVASKNVNDVQIRLVNAAGQVISNHRFPRMQAGSNYTIAIPDLPRGAYFLKVSTPTLRSSLQLLH